MPRRTIHFVDDYYYHLFSRGVNKQPIFNHPTDYRRATEVFRYYTHKKPRLRYSYFLALSDGERQNFLSQFLHSKKIVSLLAYCLMPNHFHFLLRQNEEGGINHFMRNFLISYARYFNTRYKRTGPFWEGQFKAVSVDDDAQLLHLSRYIHLNPFTSYVVDKEEELLTYLWSSFPEYLGKRPETCETQTILSHFSSRDAYRDFTIDRAAYQRELDLIRHLLVDDE